MYINDYVLIGLKKCIIYWLKGYLEFKSLLFVSFDNLF